MYPMDVLEVVGPKIHARSARLGAVKHSEERPFVVASTDGVGCIYLSCRSSPMTRRAGLTEARSSALCGAPHRAEHLPATDHPCQ